MLIFSIGSIITPIIALALWLTASSHTSVSYNQNELILYFVFAVYVGIVTEMWQAWAINERINNGDFSTLLTKPFPILMNFILENLGDKTYKIATISLSVPLVYLLVPVNIWAQINISLVSTFLFLLALVMGYLIMFFIEMSIGLSAVWFYEIGFLKNYLDLATTIFAGRVVPLVFFPGILLSIANFLPFRYSISFPIEIIINKLGFSDIIFGFGIGIFWLILTFMIYKLIYKSFVKSYKGYGG